jgi:hypothetical protein
MSSIRKEGKEGLANQRALCRIKTKVMQIPSDSSAFTRREFLQCSLASVMAGYSQALRAAATVDGPPSKFRTRGVVLVPEDLSLTDWPERASQAGLTTVALHHGAQPGEVIKFVQSPAGGRFLERCQRLGLQVEYELHAVSELLPRELFAKDKTMFRMNYQGDRTADANLCVHSDLALGTACSRALSLARTLRPTTGRYFFWGDDGKPWCRCLQCRVLSDSDQALVLENRVAAALRKEQPEAQVAHLAYANTLQPPLNVKPAPGVFLEYAPIQRRYDIPYAQQTGVGAGDGLPALDANLRVFPAATAQVLEYWLDVSRASGWRRPVVQLPWRKDVFLSDVATYRARHIQYVTSFAVWIDAEYVQRYGEPSFLREYGAGLSDT